MKKSRSKFVFKAPFNSLSFGQVSYCLTKEMFKRGLDVSVFPIGDTLDISAFDLAPKLFIDWLQKSIDERLFGINRNSKCLQLWHLRESTNSPTSSSNLFTFHEINGATDTELQICNLHDKVIFSSAFSKNVFAKAPNAHYCPIGFDEDLRKTEKKYFEDCVHFILVGKWEARKNTERIIRTWINLFGNDNRYKLTCLVDNPFYQKEAMASLISKVSSGCELFNVTFLPRLGTNSEMNDLYNSADIDLSGLSSAEGWNLPAFNATALGKWSCVARHTAHADWATADNCILVEPSGSREPYDNAFFEKGGKFNQGLIFEVSESSMAEAMKKSLQYAKSPNPNGEALREEFSYSKTLDRLLELCGI